VPKRLQLRFVCTVCGNRSRGRLQELLVAEFNKGHRSWCWEHHNLCPPCTLALRDYLNPSLRKLTQRGG